MFRTALRNVLAHRARLLMTLIAVVLGTAFISGTLVFSDSVARALRDSSARSYDGVVVMAEARPEGPGLRQKAVARLSALPGVASVRPSVEGFTAVAGPGGKALATDRGSALGANYAAVDGGPDPRNPLIAGRAPLRTGEVAVDRGTADRAKVSLGGTLRTAIDGPVRIETVVGIVTARDPRVQLGGSLVLYDAATAQRLFGRPGQYGDIAVYAARGAGTAELLRHVRRALPDPAAEVTTGSELAARQAEKAAADTSAMTKSLLTFAAIALFVSTFLIANTFTMLVSQRTREIALLRAVGATRRQIGRGILIEAALVGLVASGTGLLVGVGLAAATCAVLDHAGTSLPVGRLTVTPATTIITVVTGSVVTVLSAWLPARRAAVVPPVAALAAAQLGPTQATGRGRAVTGLLLTACGGAVMLWVTRAFHDSGGMPPALLGAALLMTGAILLAPLLCRPFVQLITRPCVRLFRVPGMLAARNVGRDPRRTAATVSALMVGAALFTGLTVAGHSARAGVEQATRDQLTADFRVTSAAGRASLDPAVARAVARVPGVAASSPVRSEVVSIQKDSFLLYGVDTANIPDLVNLRMTAGALPFAGRHELAVSETSARRNGWHVGARVTLRGERNASVVFNLTGIYRETKALGDALTDIRTFASVARLERDQKVLVKGVPNQETRVLGDRLHRALGSNPILRVQDRAEVGAEAVGIISTILQVLYGLLATSLMIALIGIVNTLGLSVHERAREIGVLRAVGLARTELRAMIRVESAILALFGVVLGTGLGMFLVSTCAPLLSSSFPEYATDVPWGVLGLTVVAAVAIGVLAGVLPARRAARVNPLEAIDSE
ncbi:FtsX-like permease family protein [Streptomyces sioyaensis]|uniref:ABC transporter permease n=1 Tax=Streptomyces sioyaensis TaxID=67364 RepID=UPI0036E94EC6